MLNIGDLSLPFFEALTHAMLRWPKYPESWHDHDLTYCMGCEL